MDIVKTLTSTVLPLMMGLFVCAWSSTALALTETVDGISYNYKIENNAAIICSNYSTYPSTPAVNCNTSGAISIPAILGGCPVVKIDYHSFEACTHLTAVAIPHSVTNLSKHAFHNCSSLISIEIDSKNPSYASSDGIVFSKNLHVLMLYPPGREGVCQIPPNTTVIDDYAFYQCDNLSSVAISANVTNICSQAFSDCHNLTEIEVNAGNQFYASKDGVIFNKTLTTLIRFPNKKGPSCILSESVTTIGDWAFAGSCHLENVTVGDAVKIIDDYAFYNCPLLARVTLGNSVEIIGSYAFADCPLLTGIALPNKVAVIKSDAFSGCKSLSSIVIPDSVVRLGERAFYGCGLFSATIGQGLIHLECFMFYGCRNLTTINIPNNITFIDYSVFGECERLKTAIIPSSVIATGDRVFADCSQLRSIIIAPGLEKISSEMFVGCTNLVNISIPNSVTCIDHAAFWQCSNIETIVIPDSVHHIEIGAFEECAKLRSITIPDSVATIGDCAFFGCTNLSEIVLGENVLLLGARTFSETLWYEQQPDNSILYLNKCCLGVKGEIVGAVQVEPGTRCIADGAFNSQCELTAVSIPESVLRLGDGAFSGAPNLSTVIAGSNICSVGAYTFAETAWFENQLDDSVIYLNNCCLRVKGSVSERVVIREGTSVIADNAFESVQEVTEIMLPDGLITIGKYAFYDATNLVSVIIPDGVKYIGDMAFFQCSALESLMLPDSVTDIGVGFASSCSRLRSVSIGNGIVTISKRAFWFCQALESVDLGNNITSIEDLAFYCCYKLSSIKIPNSVLRVNNSAFSYCYELDTVAIPDSVVYLGGYAFTDCLGLTSVSIGRSVTIMEREIFVGCSNLTTVTYWGAAPYLIGGTAMYAGTPLDMVSYVMQGSKGWNGNYNSALLPDIWPYYSDYPAYLNLTSGDHRRTICVYQGAPVAITFNGGSGVPKTIKLSRNAATLYGELPTPTRTGYVFMGWFTAAADGDEITTDSVVPDTDTTLYAQWSKGYTLTLKNGTAEATTFIAGTEVEITANDAPLNQEFQKWTVSPASVTYAEGFSVNDATAKIIMPAANVTMTAVYVKAPGSLGIECVPNNGQTVTGVEWSTDKRTWYAYDTTQRLTAGAYTVYFRSTDGKWIVPAPTKVTLNAGSADSPTLVSVNCEFAPAFDGNTLDDATNPNSDQGQWNEESGQLDWTGLRVGLRAKLGPLPLQANATSVKLKSGKLPTGLKLVTVDGQVYLSGIPTKAGTYPVVLQAMKGRKAGALLNASLDVQDLPTEYIGTFNGLYTATTNDITSHSALTLTVAKTGKLTGSVSLGGKKYSLKADAFDAIDYDTEAMSVTNAAFICTNPKLTNAISLTVSLSEAGLGMFEVTPLPTATGDYNGQAVRNGWKDKVKHALRVTAVETANGYYTLSLYPEDDSYGAGYVTLTVDAKGSVKAAGKLADGTAVSGSGVLLVTDTEVSAVIALSPSAYKGGEFYLNVKFIQDAQPRVETVEPANWVNTVTTTTSNGPFERQPSIKGGWYSKTETLYTLYGVGTPYSLRLEAEVITNAVSVSFNTKGTGVDALSKTNNPYNVKLTLTPKTGLFSGSFNEEGVKTAYKLYGILTPYLLSGTDDAAGLGFYNIPVVGPPKTQRSELFRLATEVTE